MDVVEHAERPYIQTMKGNIPVTINLRLQSREMLIIDRAAKCCGISSEDFILESALEKAKEVLEEQTDFILSPKQWEEFMNILDRPPKSNPGLDRLMATVPIWEHPEEGVGHQ